jgi:hypothetical protein
MCLGVGGFRNGAVGEVLAEGGIHGDEGDQGNDESQSRVGMDELIASGCYEPRYSAVVTSQQEPLCSCLEFCIPDDYDANWQR